MAPDNAAAAWEHLGKRLEESRLRRGLILAQVEAATGVSENTIVRWEKGRNRSANKLLYRLVGFYGWPLGAVDRVLAGGMEYDDLPVVVNPDGPRARMPMQAVPEDIAGAIARVAEEIGLSPEQQARLAAALADRTPRSI